jgi:hypothetical protein
LIRGEEFPRDVEKVKEIVLKSRKKHAQLKISSLTYGC